MGKKIAAIILTLVFLAVLAGFIFNGFNNEPVIILFLGDSIAEGIAGMSPVSERENYAYYGIIGGCNNYIHRNRAVSGFKTSNLLELIKQPDKDVTMTQTLLREADIIHVSILGNDLLLNDLGGIIIFAAQNDFTFLESILSNSAKNFSNIVAMLKAYNPDATLMFQTLYNPVFEDSTLISASSRAQLRDLGIEPEDYRELTHKVLQRLNAVIRDYLEQNPGSFHIIDAYEEFENIYRQNPDRGRRLISIDCIHPSSEGHGIMACLIQNKLQELGLANKDKALKKYKYTKKDQLRRLYKDSVDVDGVSQRIDGAQSFEEVTEIYFDAIYNVMPIY
ncbi:MAG: SGNH/GDSL hydrolase family protein [Christensenellales bacterium]|jgi:lysophospholipase L1-like esterase|nr:SGNH/GDSL hydrolase family protein [Clostridiales bacterium]